MTITDYHRVPYPCVGARSAPSPRLGSMLIQIATNHAQDGTAAPRWSWQSSGQCSKVGKKRVWTMSTLLASDWAVHRSDRAGFRMFPRESSVRKGWNAVRVPPRARHNPSPEGFLL
jgi:hypothetical protein